MLRWDSLAKIMVGANGEGLMDELGDTGRTVAEFGPIMFGAEVRFLTEILDGFRRFVDEIWQF